MADTYKVLAQSNPLATTLTDIYTVPSGKMAVVSSITVCNRDGAVALAYRIAVAVAGSADNNKQYLFYDSALAANTTDKHVLGISLNQTDVIRVYVDNATASFNVFGLEV